MACMEPANLSTGILEQISKLIQEDSCDISTRLSLSSHFHSD